MKANIIHDYCTGCGLCEAINNSEVKREEDGHYYPVLKEKKEIDFCSTVCPSSGHYLEFDESKLIWGSYISAWYGYSNDSVIREKASSGGVLSSLAIFLLEKKEVDGIIHVEADEATPYETIISISTSTEDVLRHAGSRYSISAPLKEINRYLDQEKKYAFIGKPCDVSALRSYMSIDENVKKSIKYMFSFFCAGQPSNFAQLKLLKELNCLEPEKCSKLNYRGNGWPGETTCIQRDGVVQSMSYEKSWGTILGRDVKKACRFCMDGIGLCADIVCGDAWYLNENMEPDFKEADGRNIILSRSELGERLLKRLSDEAYLHLEAADVSLLKNIQPYQFERRATMIDKVIAMRLMGRTTPNYKIEKMFCLANNVGIRRHLSIFKGTIKRIIDGKI